MRAWQDRLHALKNLPPVLSLLWNSGRMLVATEVSLRIVSALIPVTMLWVSKLIIDSVVAAGAGQHIPALRIWTLLAAEFLLAAIATVIGRTIDYCDGRIADRFSLNVSLRIMDHSATLDVASFEDPVFYDVLERARVQATDRIAMLHALGTLIQQFVTLLSLSAGVIVFSPWLFLALVACITPMFLGESHFAFLGYSLAHSLTPVRRELDYLRVLATSKESAKEVKIFGLSGYLRKRFDEISGGLIDRNRLLARKRLWGGSLLSLDRIPRLLRRVRVPGDPGAPGPTERRQPDFPRGRAGGVQQPDPVDLLHLRVDRRSIFVPHRPGAILRGASADPYRPRGSAGAPAHP